MADAVPGFEVTTFSHDGRTHEVYRAGTGPAVIVMYELPGLYPGMAVFGQRLVDAGYRVYLRALAARAHQECGGPGVGAVGPGDLASVKTWTAGGLCVLGLRFNLLP